MNNIDRVEVTRRVKKYNPDVPDRCFGLLCTIFELLITEKGIKMASIDSEEEWVEKQARAKWSVELEVEMKTEGIDVEAELMNVLLEDISLNLDSKYQLGYIKMERAMDEKSFAPRIEILIGGIDE